MSVLDAFFSKGFFKASRCKTLLKLTIPRIKLLRNRREMQLKQMRRDIAKLLETGQEATARIRVEHIIREENMMAAQEIIELFCELISVRLPIIEAQRECPLDLKEAISTICFAAPRCADLPELLQVQMMFSGKYGKEFIAAASELRPDSGVNRQVIELLSVRVPPVEVKMKLLKDIAEEHEVDWDPAATEAEFLKPHADLLNGPSQFIGGSTLPFPKEKDEEPLYCAPAVTVHDELKIETDEDLGSFDLPEVPKVSILPDSVRHEVTKVFDHLDSTATAPLPSTGIPTTTSAPADMPSQTSDLHVESRNPDPTPFNSNRIQHPDLKIAESSAANAQFSNALAEPKEINEFTDFVAPSLPIPAHHIVPSPDRWKETLPHPVQESFNSCSSTPMSQTETEINLVDVLAAAQTAAESADRAAAAARAAASLAQLRITELMTKRNGQTCVMNANEIHPNDSIQTDLSSNQVVDQDFLIRNEMPPYSSTNEPVVLSNSQFTHQTLRSSSLDEDPYFSYPNLFSRQNSDIKSSVVGDSQTSKE